MPDPITARLSDEIPQPELSKMGESERTTFTSGSTDGIDSWLTAPEMDIDARGTEVQLRFPAGGGDQQKLRAAFERAVHRYRPDARVEWAA
jgi:hypothetical protein